MTQVIDPTDERYFTSTSNGLYDRHTYKLNIPNQGSVILEDYETLRKVWFEKVRNYSPKKLEEVLSELDNNKEVKLLNIQDLNYASEDTILVFKSWFYNKLTN